MLLFRQKSFAKHHQIPAFLFQSLLLLAILNCMYAYCQSSFQPTLRPNTNHNVSTFYAPIQLRAILSSSTRYFAVIPWRHVDWTWRPRFDAHSMVIPIYLNKFMLSFHPPRVNFFFHPVIFANSNQKSSTTMEYLRRSIPNSKIYYEWQR